jgi:hypothetical protein
MGHLIIQKCMKMYRIIERSLVNGILLPRTFEISLVTVYRIKRNGRMFNDSVSRGPSSNILGPQQITRTNSQ